MHFTIPLYACIYIAFTLVQMVDNAAASGGALVWAMRVRAYTLYRSASVSAQHAQHSVSCAAHLVHACYERDDALHVACQVPQPHPCTEHTACTAQPLPPTPVADSWAAAKSLPFAASQPLIPFVCTPPNTPHPQGRTLQVQNRECLADVAARHLGAGGEDVLERVLVLLQQKLPR